MQRLGKSFDDAAGEAFDKVGRLLGLSYPGGPAIEKIAKNGDPMKFNLPKCRISDKKGGFLKYDFSFSGLKTAVLYKVNELKREGELSNQLISNICLEFQNAAIDCLLHKTNKAISSAIFSTKKKEEFSTKFTIDFPIFL